MLKSKWENRLVNCLVCFTCHSRMGLNHFTLNDGGAVCSLCSTKNPLGNLKKMSLQEVTEPSEITVCFTRGGTIAHALHFDEKTVLGPWIRFQSAERLEKAIKYLGATEEQVAAHRKTMQQTGQGSTHVRLLAKEEPAEDRLQQTLSESLAPGKAFCILVNAIGEGTCSIWPRHLPRPSEFFALSSGSAVGSIASSMKQVLTDAGSWVPWSSLRS
jgi:hypothetical protein